jgi:RNA polymerase sigma-70 factor, ECF subfamily
VKLRQATLGDAEQIAAAYPFESEAAWPTLGSGNMTSAADSDCVRSAWLTHQREIAGFVRHQLGEHDAADLVQEVFLRATRLGREFCELEMHRAWLFEIARNLTVDRLRRRKKEPLFFAQEDGTVAPCEPDGRGATAIEELGICIPNVLRTLASEDRDVLVSCDLREETVSAYAHRTALTLPAAKARLRRARTRLRLRLSELCTVSIDPMGRVADFVRLKGDRP